MRWTKSKSWKIPKSWLARASKKNMDLAGASSRCCTIVSGGNVMEIRTFGNGYLVYYMGEDIYFNTLEEAESFIEKYFYNFRRTKK